MEKDDATKNAGANISDGVRDALDRLMNMSGEVNRVLLTLRQTQAAADQLVGNQTSLSRSDVEQLQAEIQRLKDKVSELNERLEVSENKSMEQAASIIDLEAKLKEKTHAAAVNKKKLKTNLARSTIYVESFPHVITHMAGFGVDFLNFLLSTGLLSDPKSAEACMDAFMYTIGLSADSGALNRWNNSRGFVATPGVTDPTAELLTPKDIQYEDIRERYAEVVGRDLPPAGIDLALRLFDPTNLAIVAAMVEETEMEPSKPKAADTVSNQGVSEADESSPDKTAGDMVVEANQHSQPVAAPKSRNQLEPYVQSTAVTTHSNDEKLSGDMGCGQSQSSMDRATSRKKTKARVAMEPKKSTPSKKVRTDKPPPRPESRVTVDTRIVTKRASDEETPQGGIQQRAVIDMRHIMTLHGRIMAQAPWKRAAGIGTFLPTIMVERPVHPRHEKSVELFNQALERFWRLAGQPLWTRLFQTHNDPRARDQLAYHILRLVFELHQLIKNSDFDDTLIQYLCHPHPAWPQFPDPVDLDLVRAFGGKEEALAYLTDQNSRFWPVAPAKASRSKTGSVKDFSCPLGSAFSAVRGRGPRSNPSSQLSYWKRMREYNSDSGTPEAMYAGDPPSPADVSAMVREMVNETCSVANLFVRSGAKFASDKVLPFVAYDLPGCQDRPEQWFHGVPVPLTEYRWSGEKSVPFWRVTPQRNDLAQIISIDSSEDEGEKENSDDSSEKTQIDDAADGDSRDSSSA